MNKQPKSNDYKELINELEQEFYTDFIETTHGISKELANRLIHLSDEDGYYISTEIIIRFCIHEIARRIAILSPTLKNATMRSIEIQVKHLSRIYLEKILERDNEDYD